MADGITTRVQKEVGILHKELEVIRVEIVTANDQLMKEMEARIEASNLETRKMFAQIMLKFDSSQGSGPKGSRQ